MTQRSEAALGDPQSSARRLEAGLLTKTRASMMSLQICRLVALVTSKNKLEVVFLILKRNEHFRKEESYQQQTPATATLNLGKPPTVPLKLTDRPRAVRTRTRRGPGRPTLVFSLLVIGGKEMTSPSASRRQGNCSFPSSRWRYLRREAISSAAGSTRQIEALTPRKTRHDPQLRAQGVPEPRSPDGIWAEAAPWSCPAV